MDLARRRIPLRPHAGPACNRRQSFDLSPEEQATIDALNAEQARLESDYQDADELPDEVDQRLGEMALLAVEHRLMIYDPAEIVRAGVFVSIDSEGWPLC